MRLLFTLFLSSLFYIAHSQTGNSNGESAYALSLGNASIALPGVYGLQGNQAALVFGQDSEFLLSAERRFLLADLTSVSFEKNLGFGTVGILVENFGFDAFREQKLAIAYARKLNEKLSIGGQFDYLNFSIEGYGNKSSFTFELGVYSIVNKYFHVSAHVFSPGKIGLTDNTDVTSIFRTGFKYIPSKKLQVFGELYKALDETLDFRSGIDYQLVDILYLRAGFNTEPSRFSFGFGCQITDRFFLEGGNAYHPQLGNTPGVSLKIIP